MASTRWQFDGVRGNKEVQCFVQTSSVGAIVMMKIQMAHAICVTQSMTRTKHWVGECAQSWPRDWRGGQGSCLRGIDEAQTHCRVREERMHATVVKVKELRGSRRCHRSCTVLLERPAFAGAWISYRQTISLKAKLPSSTFLSRQLTFL